MQQSNRMMNVSSSSRVLGESQMNNKGRSQLEEMMEQATMRKTNSSIQILQRVVSNKENNRETMNTNINMNINNTDSLKMRDIHLSLLMNDKRGLMNDKRGLMNDKKVSIQPIQDKKVPVKSYNRI